MRNSDELKNIYKEIYIEKNGTIKYTRVKGMVTQWEQKKEDEEKFVNSEIQSINCV